MTGATPIVMSATREPNPELAKPCSAWLSHAARVLVLISAIVLIAATPARAANPVNDTCFECHGDRSDPEVPFVDGGVFAKSVHKDLACNACHDDVNPDDLPHADDLKPVYCGRCHDDQQLDFDASIHGQALHRKQPYAPSCKDCHGVHDIFAPSDERSTAFKMNVPVSVREVPPRRRPGGQHLSDLGAQHSRELHGKHPRRGAVQEGTDGDGGVRRLPPRPPDSAAHRPARVDLAAQHHRHLHEVPLPHRGGPHQGHPRRTVGEGTRRHSGLHRLPRAAQGSARSGDSDHL